MASWGKPLGAPKTLLRRLLNDPNRGPGIPANSRLPAGWETNGTKQARTPKSVNSLLTFKPTPKFPPNRMGCLLFGHPLKKSKLGDSPLRRWQVGKLSPELRGGALRGGGASAANPRAVITTMRNNSIWQPIPSNMATWQRLDLKRKLIFQVPPHSCHVSQRKGVYIYIYIHLVVFSCCFTHLLM